MKLPKLYPWLDSEARPASEQMALDEALFRLSEESGNAVARFYGWDKPATTFGYFVPATGIGIPGAVRRFTGGGKVEHGEDLTFLLTLPGGTEPAKASGEDRYRWVHSALARALRDASFPVKLESENPTAATGPCFQNPVSWDLLDPDSNEKIGGGAQRRTRRGVIHQGSVRLPEGWRRLNAPWIERFLERLSNAVIPFPQEEKEKVLQSASELEQSRYATKAWNELR